jgi:hypothetical protein
MEEDCVSVFIPWYSESLRAIKRCHFVSAPISRILYIYVGSNMLLSFFYIDCA